MLSSFLPAVRSVWSMNVPGPLRSILESLRINTSSLKVDRSPLETVLAERPRLAFLGGGNMAKALMGGIIQAGLPGSHVSVSDPKPANLEAMANSMGVQTFLNNRDAWQGCDVVVLAVKPKIIHDVCVELRETYEGKMPLVISIAAGVWGTDIIEWLGGHDEVIRVMPNTPALVQSGVTGMWAAAGVSDVQKNLAEGLFDGVGLSCWVDEETKLDTAVTPLSGSSPAYFFLFMESMINMGKELGLSEEMSRRLVVQTCAGAAKMVAESSEPVSVLKQRVMSPNGTTEAAIKTFEAMGIRNLVEQAMKNCGERALEIGEEFHDEFNPDSNTSDDVVGGINHAPKIHHPSATTATSNTTATTSTTQQQQ